MSEASLREALRRGKITREDLAAYPPYPADWYIGEDQVPESRRQVQNLNIAEGTQSG
jgi:hypothetical protein